MGKVGNQSKCLAREKECREGKEVPSNMDTSSASLRSTLCIPVVVSFKKCKWLYIIYCCIVVLGSKSTHIYSNCYVKSPMKSLPESESSIFVRDTLVNGNIHLTEELGCILLVSSLTLK